MLRPMAGVWPRGSMNMRVSKSMRGRRLAIAMLRVVSLTRLRPPSPGMPARSVIRVVAPEGRPETQIWSPSRVTAAPGTGGSSRTQSCGVEIVAADGGDGEVDAGARRLGLRLGGDAAHQDAGGAARLVQLLHDRLVVGGAFGGGLQRLDRLGRAVQHLQRVGHQQQRRHLRGAVSTVEKFCQAACRAWRASGGVRCICASANASHCAGVASPWAMRRSRAAIAAGQSCLRIAAAAACLGLLAGLRGAAGGEARGQGAGIGIAVGFQAGQGEVVRPGGTRRRARAVPPAAIRNAA